MSQSAPGGEFDAAGNLKITTAGQTAPGTVRLQDGAGATLAPVLTNQDGGGTLTGLIVQAQMYGFDGAAVRLIRVASAGNLGGQSGVGAALVAPPGQWAVSSTPAAGTQGSAVKAAGGAGIRHIANAVDYGYGATTALAAAAQRLLNLRDGASGAGTVLLALSIPVPAATILATNNDALEGRAHPGTAATAMTAEFDASQANLFESVAITGYDASP